MSDNQFNICKCVWNHEQAMQRLLAFIRQNQNECTDAYCDDAVSSLHMNVHQNNRDVGSSENYSFIIIMVLLFAYLLSISPFVATTLKRFSRRTYDNGDGNGGNSSTSSFQPPPAPPAIN